MRPNRELRSEERADHRPGGRPPRTVLRRFLDSISPCNRHLCDYLEMKLDRRDFPWNAQRSSGRRRNSAGARARQALFSDENVDREKLVERSYMRWNTLPPDVIPLTAADPDFPVAQEIFGRGAPIRRRRADGIRSVRRATRVQGANRRDGLRAVRRLLSTGAGLPVRRRVRRHVLHGSLRVRARR